MKTSDPVSNSNVLSRSPTGQVECRKTRDLATAAAIYARRFMWQVIPLKPKGKTPITPNGLKDGATRQDVIQQWWNDNPNANIGIVTGSVSGIVVLDLDARHGGLESLERLEEEFGKLPSTPTVLTGSGNDSQHRYFKHSGGIIRNKAGILPGIDLRGDGGYVVAPPSLHESGREYTWEASARIDEGPLAEMPEWLLRLVRQDGKESSKKPDSFWSKLALTGIPEGTRNQTLTTIAGHLLRRFVNGHLCLWIVKLINRTACKPPLPEDEVERIIDSVAGLELRRQERMKGGAA